MDFKTPGVYVEEISTLPASVAPVGTAIPAFLGFTEYASSSGNSGGADLVYVPTRITSLVEYREKFGGPQAEENLVITVNDVTASDTRTISMGSASTYSSFNLYYALQMYFANGGGPCWIVSGGVYSSDLSADLNYVVGTSVSQKSGRLVSLSAGNCLEAISKIDEPTLLVVPEAVGLNTTQHANIISKILENCNKLQDRFGIFDVLDNGEPGNGTGSDSDVFRNLSISGPLKYGAAYYPYLNTTLPLAYNPADVDVEMIVDGTASPIVTLDTLKSSDNPTFNQVTSFLGTQTVTLPPSSTIAGIYARVDRDRGVWKAPANVAITNILGPNTLVKASDQEDLNVDPTAGKSINAIRTFVGKGTLVWGARTLAGNDNEWRYVPVRRLFIFLEESIQKATESMVFEANDATTWLRVKTMIQAFLNQQWSAGALAGSTPEQAYFVNVGLGSTMNTQDILEGRMIVEIGVAAVRPAEFIILRFSHKLQES